MKIHGFSSERAVNLQVRIQTKTENISFSVVVAGMKQNNLIASGRRKL
jgi:hypothetical protein